MPEEARADSISTQVQPLASGNSRSLLRTSRELN